MGAGQSGARRRINPARGAWLNGDRLRRPISAARPRSACRASCSIISTAAPMPRSRCGATSPISPRSRCASASSSTFPKIDLTTRLFGCDLAMPVGLGPVGMSGMYARRGEAQAARAAAAKGIPICLSSVSVCDLREVAAAGGEPALVPALRDQGPRLHGRAARRRQRGEAAAPWSSPSTCPSPARAIATPIAA